MSDNEAKALELVAEAEKKLNSSRSFFGFFGRQAKKDEALECYERAANLFKMGKKWSRAGQTFVTLSQVLFLAIILSSLKLTVPIFNILTLSIFVVCYCSTTSRGVTSMRRQPTTSMPQTVTRSPILTVR